jgi:signal transduction histidine kinase
VSDDARQGLGLGLYIASEIARAHGGTLEATSSAEETRFTFRMPI